jgi:RsiW-degrading membrane proteinase PrsW (M82 family)
MDLIGNLFDNLPSFLGAAAIAPSLLILWTVAAMDSRREPARVVVVAFLLGAGIAVLLSFLHLQFPGISSLKDWPIIQTYLHTTLEIAAPEEAAKLIVLLFFCFRYIAYDHPMEGVVYGAAVGLGFAAYENFFYLVNNPEIWKTVAVMRGIFTVPVHGALGVILGIYVAKARFAGRLRRHRGHSYQIKSYAIGLGVVTVLHGLFDFPLFVQQRLGSSQDDYAIMWPVIGMAMAGLVCVTAASIIYRARKSQATAPNSFTVGRRFQNHQWHVTALICIALFLIALPLLGWARQILIS